MADPNNTLDLLRGFALKPSGAVGLFLQTLAKRSDLANALQALKPDEPGALSLALNALRLTAPAPEVLPAALSLARHPAAVVRAAASRLLGRFGGAEAADALEAACDDPDPRARSAALSGLAAVDSARAGHRLRRDLADPPRSDQRAALRSLRALAAEEPSIVATALPDPLRDRLLDDADADVRGAVVSSLGDACMPLPKQRLGALLADEARPVRMLALRAVDRACQVEASPFLRRRLDEAQGAERRVVLRLLGELRAPTPAKALLALRTDLASVADRVAWWAAAVPVSGPSFATEVEEDLGDVSPAVRAAAVLAIPGALGSGADARLGYIVRCDPEVVVRAAAAKALASGNAEVAGPALVVATQDRDASVRLSALNALGRLGWRPAVLAMRTRPVPDDRPWEQAEWAKALQLLGDADAVMAGADDARPLYDPWAEGWGATAWMDVSAGRYEVLPALVACITGRLMLRVGEVEHWIRYEAANSGGTGELHLKGGEPELPSLVTWRLEHRRSSLQLTLRSVSSGPLGVLRLRPSRHRGVRPR